jgi:hypothetical protein
MSSTSTEQEEVKISKAVKEATTLKDSGFPVNTAEGVIMATAKNPDGTIETEMGTMEISDDPHVLQPAGTAEANAKAAAKTAAAEEKSAAKS